MKAYLSSIRNQDAKARISMAMMIAPMTMRTVRLTMGNGRGDGTNIRYSCTVRTSIKVKPRNLRRLISVTRTPVRSGKVVKCRCTYSPRGRAAAQPAREETAAVATRVRVWLEVMPSKVPMVIRETPTARLVPQLGWIASSASPACRRRSASSSAWRSFPRSTSPKMIKPSELERALTLKLGTIRLNIVMVACSRAWFCRMRRLNNISSNFILRLPFRMCYTFTKNCPSNTNNRCSFFNRYCIIVGHSHRKMMPGMLRQFVTQAITQHAQGTKYRTHLFRIGYQRRNRHQPLNFKVGQFANLTGQRRRFSRSHTFFTFFARDIDLEHDGQPYPEFPCVTVQCLSKAEAINAMNAIEIPHHLPRFIALQMSDHMPAHILGTKGGNLWERLLHTIFPKMNHP